MITVVLIAVVLALDCAAAFAVSAYAVRKGSARIPYFVLSMILSPIIGLLLVWALPQDQD